MNRAWKTVKLGEIARYITGKKNSNAAISNGEYPFFTCSPITLAINTYSFDQRAILLAGNNANGVFSVKKYIGKFDAYQRTYIIDIIDDSTTFFDYIFYAITMQLQLLQHISVGSTTKFLTKPILDSLSIPLPPLAEQERIAAILSAFDDKIETNRKICGDLEAAAKLIFRRDFIANPEAEGWEVVRLGEYFPIITGKQNVNITNDDGIYPFFSCSQNIGKTNQYSFDGNAILLAGNGDFNIKWYRGKFEAYQRTYVLMPYTDEYFFFLYCLMKYFLSDIVIGHRGSVISFITKGMIENFSFKLPPKKLLTNTEKILNLLFSQVENLQLENRSLAQARDLLLPRLMRGEV